VLLRQPVRKCVWEGTSVLDHGRRRGSYRVTVEAEHIDLGNEPPLSVDGERSDVVDRRRVSVQWFSGTILTGLCGAALMGGAVFAALDGETNFATVPERVELALRGAVGGAGATRKADRLPPALELNSLRRVIPATQTISRGPNNREFMRKREFVRVAGNLSLSVSELSANLPPFNPQKTMLADAAAGGAPGAEEAAEADIDAEVSFVARDLSPLLARAKIAAVLPIDDVLARVRDATNWPGTVPAKSPQQDLRNVKLAYAAEGSLDPYEGFTSRIVPENITLLPKTATQTTGGNDFNEKTFTLKKGDSVSTVLRDLGAKPEEIKAITAALGARGKDGGVKEGQKLRVLMAPAADSKRLQPVRVIVANEAGVDAVAALSDLGKYVAVDVRSMDTDVAQVREEEEDDGKGVRLYQSIYETALRNQVPRILVEDLIRIYSYDVDFQRKVQAGDSFEVLFAGEDEGSPIKPEVLFASLTTAGETRKFYRYQSTDDGVVDYYDETGKSAKKFLVRKPVAEGLMTSPFGSRNHPLLNYTRLHTGVDWGAPMGTPIYASGNGVIEKIGWEGGYGKYIRIRHANGYATGYGHMSAFARNMTEGKKVRQGQVIGYVGSTGLSTGAHLHYEIMINGRFVDPMKIKLPRGRVLEGPLLSSFEQERDRLDGMMSRGAPSAAAGGTPKVAQSADATR
jgi:murein DD-endopeptidase MepM/ murein hydrolase activator NlpD